jgi:hypothetical protein
MQPSTADRAAAPDSRRILWPIAIALAIRLTLWWLIPTTRLASDEDGYVPAGLRLAATGQQDLFWPPVTGWLVAALSTAFGTSAIQWIRLAWIAMDLGCLLLLGRVARRLAPAVAGADAARADRFVTAVLLGYAIYLPAISFSQFATSEVPALLQLLLLLTFVLHRTPSMPRSIAAGLLGGTLVLTRPSLLPLVVLVPVALALRWPKREWIRHVTVMLVLTGAVVGALVIRNWRQFGEPTIATNSAYNLYIGNRELYAEDLNLFDPRATPEQIEFRRQYFSGTLPAPVGTPADLQREALDSIKDRPGLFLRRAFGRLARIFVPKTDVLELLGGESRAGVFAWSSVALLAVANLQWAIVLFAGLAGLAWWWRADRGTGALLLSLVLGSLPLCLIAISKPRYAFPFEPVLLLAAVSVLLAPAATRGRIRSSDRRLIAICATFILWGWAAWAIFSVTSRLALAGAA